MTETYIKVPFSDPNEELKFVDSDIAEACRKMGNYIIGTPTQMQLCRNLRELATSLAELKTSPRT